MTQPKATAPPPPSTSTLTLPRTTRVRQGRNIIRTPTDEHPNHSYGDSPYVKDAHVTRLFFQNVKGLTHSSSGEDYKYYLSSLHDLSVDIAGLAETNSAWYHPHLKSDFKQCVQRQFGNHRVSFGHPSPEVDPPHFRETFQAGGSATIATGDLVPYLHGSSITDPSGLGRWSGFTIRGANSQYLSIITAYRTCARSTNSGSVLVGSAFNREYEHFRSLGMQGPRPRQLFLRDMKVQLQKLKADQHSIILMLDANSTLAGDLPFASMISECDLHDLHKRNPATSTFMGAKTSRIDFIFGCPHVEQATERHDTLSYYEGPQADHRSLLFIDLDLHTLLSIKKQTTSASPTSRLLKSGNPELVLMYNEAMLQYYADHNMLERLANPQEHHLTYSRRKTRKLLEAWDEDQGRAMKHAEASLRRPPQPYQWSAVLRNCGILRHYWRLRLREHLHFECHDGIFDSLQRQIQEADSTFKLPFLHIDLPLPTIRKSLNDATKALKHCQRSATGIRYRSYYDLAATYASDTNPSTMKESARKAKIVHRTITSEKCKQLFFHLRSIVKPRLSGGLSKILTPRDQTATTETTDFHQGLAETEPKNLVWDTTVDRATMETHLQAFNRQSFRAASDSPCGHGLLHDALTFTSLSTTAKSILEDGSWPPDLTRDVPFLGEFLASFAIPKAVSESKQPAIPTEITPDDVTYGFKKWKESTSTSPSVRHLGHYKSLIQDPTLLGALTSFLNITIQRGLSVSRWSNATNVLIEKDPGTPRIHRLRIIHLFEADFNLFLKLIWGSRLVKRAVHLDLLNTGQHGSVPRRTSIDPIMLTQLTTDLCHLLKINLARFDNDASACYDRIIVALAMMAARRCGMPLNAIRTHAEALQFMRYTVKTIHGVSETNYSGTPFEPLFGTGQGSGASPAVGLSLVVILMNTMDRIIPERMAFASPDGTNQHGRLLDAFVDDTSLGFTDPGALDFDGIVDRLREIAQTWEQLLQLSGGSLNLSKCAWHILFWEWPDGRPTLRPINEDDPALQLYQGANRITVNSIRRTTSNEASRILGVYPTPSPFFSTDQDSSRQSRKIRHPIEITSSKSHRHPNFSPNNIRSGDEIPFARHGRRRRGAPMHPNQNHTGYAPKTRHQSESSHCYSPRPDRIRRHRFNGSSNGTWYFYNQVPSQRHLHAVIYRHPHSSYPQAPPTRSRHRRTSPRVSSTIHPIFDSNMANIHPPVHVQPQHHHQYHRRAVNQHHSYGRHIHHGSLPPHSVHGSSTTRYQSCQTPPPSNPPVGSH